jgi:NADH-quinone oxidoreductase subunit L
MIVLLTLVPAAPLIAALLVCIFGYRLPKRGAWLPVLGTAVSLTAVLLLPRSGTTAQIAWFTLSGLTLNIGLHLDPLSWFMCVLVAAIALLVNLYAVEYMQTEKEGRVRFYAWMSLFAGAMLALVLASSFLLFYAAWEAVGLASWGLIGFCYKDRPARRSAQMAFLMTRFGDFGMLLGWLLVVTKLRNVDIDVFLNAVVAGRLDPRLLTLLALLFFAAAVGKSAQLPLTGWLPEAMVGPTPVSALLHSATMVAAGVYLVLRLFPLFQAAPGALPIVLWTGAITAVFAALVATAQADLKRILAWSTVSQLGEMMIALGLAAPAAALFHLSTHAVFKSGLFLAAGIVERSTRAKELEKMGGLKRALPIVGLAFGACSLALAGFPLLSGFWSEEKIMQAAAHVGISWILCMLLLIFLAGVYISRAAAGVFLNWPGAPIPDTTRKPQKLILVPSLLLAVGAAVIGSLLQHPVEQALPIHAAAGELSRTWRAWAIVASVTGILFGGWRVLVAGPVPSFVPWLERLATALYRASLAPAHMALALTRRMWAEGVLDRSAKGIARFAEASAISVENPEESLDRGANAIASFAQDSAAGVEKIETGGFAAETGRLAAAIWNAGGWLRGLETGKIYTYTRTVFIWTIFVVCLFALIWR